MYICARKRGWGWKKANELTLVLGALGARRVQPHQVHEDVKDDLVWQAVQRAELLGGQVTQVNELRVHNYAEVTHSLHARLHVRAVRRTVSRGTRPSHPPTR